MATQTDLTPRAPSRAQLFAVQGIPSLVILSPDGKVVTAAGDDAVRADPEGADFPWLPKPVRRRLLA